MTFHRFSSKNNAISFLLFLLSHWSNPLKLEHQNLKTSQLVASFSSKEKTNSNPYTVIFSRTKRKETTQHRYLENIGQEGNTKPSMEIRKGSQSAQKHPANLALSPSSSSSSCSSFSASVVPLTCSPVEQTALPYRMGSRGISIVSLSDCERLRFVDTAGNEWRIVENRFNRLAITGNGHEPVVKWSDFGSCIGENYI